MRQFILPLRLLLLARASAWMGLLFWGAMANAVVEWSVPDRSQMVLANDMTSVSNLTATATGDFNGDGKKDLAVLMGYSPIQLFLGDLIGSTGTFTSRVNARTNFPSRQVFLADMDGDGFDELIWVSDDIRVFRGRGVVPAILDIATADLILQVTQDPSIAVGDFNGDGKKDLVVGEGGFNNQAGRVTLVLSSATFVTGSYPIASHPAAKVFSGKASSGLGGSVTTGDVNGDERDDLVLSAGNAGTGERFQAGEVYVFFQPAALAGPINMATASPDLTILGPPNPLGPRPRIECLAVGDFNGDADPEAFIWKKNNLSFFLIDGRDLPSGPGPHVVDLVTGSTHSVSTVDLFPFGIDANGMPSFGDFDGDGALDYFFRDVDFLSQAHLLGVLSGQRGPLPFELTRPSSASVQLTPPGGVSPLGDINGDGRDDLFYYTVNDVPPSPPYGTLYLLPGVAGVWDPSIVLTQTDEAARRVQATLRARGEVARMRLSGDLVDGDKDQWIPYVPSRLVTLTSDLGPKTVHVTFEDATGLPSDTASATLSLNANEPAVRVFTNRIRRGANPRAVWDCTLPAPGPIRARVYDRLGNRVAELVNQSFPAGVVAVEWDGKSSSGQWVAPGAYILVLEANGRSERLDIVVEP